MIKFSSRDERGPSDSDLTAKIRKELTMDVNDAVVCSSSVDSGAAPVVDANSAAGGSQRWRSGHRGSARPGELDGDDGVFVSLRKERQETARDNVATTIRR